MIPHLIDYHLVILVLLWFCLILPHLRPHPPRGMPKRATVPKPFAGLTYKSHCALCEHETRPRSRPSGTA
jgi:hypothetical protein